MNTAVPTDGLYDPPKPYLDSLDALHRRNDLGQLQLGIAQIIDRALQTRDLAQRNRLWFDCVHLLRRDWHRDLRPALLDNGEIERAVRQLETAPDVPEKLKILTEDVRREAWPDFAAFQASPEGRRDVDFGVANWLGDYHAWLDKYLPCLLIDLPADIDQAVEVLNLRIAWMVDKVATEGDDPYGHREGLLDKCAGYVRAHWLSAETNPAG